MKWIKCSERLPEIGDLVLVCTKKRNVRALMRQQPYEGSSTWFWDQATGGAMHLPEAVTHWMQLPDLPNE